MLPAVGGGGKPAILGAIFAGGQARRFGGDKAAALLDGMALLDHVAGRLRGQVSAVVVVGREWPGLERIDDRPAAGLGPLGALAGALCHAAASGFGTVLTSGCDLPDLPLDLAEQLAPAPAIVAGQPLLGLWPAAMGDRLLEHLQTTPKRSMRGWIAAAGARPVELASPLANINTGDDLAALVRRREDPRSSR